MPTDTLTPDTTQQPAPEAKQPDRIATSKVEAYLNESRECLEITSSRADIAAMNSESAAYYAKDARDSVNRFLLIAALGGIGLALVTLGSLLALFIMGLGTGHIIIM